MMTIAPNSQVSRKVIVPAPELNATVSSFLPLTDALNLRTVSRSLFQAVKKYDDRKLIRIQRITGTENRHGSLIYSVSKDKEGVLISKDTSYVKKRWSFDGTLLESREMSGHMDFDLSDGKKVSVHCPSKRAVVLDRDNNVLCQLRGFDPARVKAVLQTSDGSIVISHVADMEEDLPITEVWNLDGTKKCYLAGHWLTVNAIAICPVSGHIVTGSSDHLAKIWDDRKMHNSSGLELAELRGHNGPISSVAVKSNGDIVTASSDKTVKVWSPEGHLKSTLADPRILNSAITGMVLLDDNTVLLSSWDGRVSLWGLHGALQTQKKIFDTQIKLLTQIDANCFAVASQSGEIAIVEITSLKDLKGA